jgi:hypothetical protein
MVIPISLPLGADTDPVLSFSLAEIQREFPTDHPYFASPKVVCLQDPIHPYADENCSTLATAWVAPTSGWSTAVYVAPVTTPEPRWDIVALVLVVLFVVLWWRWK